MNVKLKKKVTWWRYFIIPKGQTPLVENMKPNLELFSSNNISLFIFFIATIWILKASHNEEGEEEKKERKRGRVQGRENKNFGKLDNSKSIFLSSISFFVFYYFRVRRRNIKAGDENAVQYSTKQYSTVQNRTSHHITIQYSTVIYNTIQYRKVQCSTILNNTQMLLIIPVLDSNFKSFMDDGTRTVFAHFSTSSVESPEDLRS